MPGLKFAVASALIGATALLVSGGASSPAAGIQQVSPSVRADIRAVFNKPAYKGATWALRVIDGPTVLVDLNSDRPLLIGSVRKVFSVGQLLNAVGGSHTYDTPVYRTGAVDHGVLRGNLILVASGDLTMGGRTNPDGSIAVSDWDHNEADSLGNAILTKPDPLAGYRKLARAVRAAGISRIAGNVVVDDRLFQPFKFRGEFNVKPIFVNDDLVDLSMTPGGKPGTSVDVLTRPVSAALRVDNRLRTGPPNAAPNTLTIKPVLPACIGLTGCTSTIAGTLPSNFIPPLTGRRELVQTIRIVEPSNYARTVFIESLKSAGITVDAPAVQANPVRLLPAQNAYRPAAKVAQLTGLPYAADAKLILKISYNIGADTSLVLFGLTKNVDSMEAALRVERENLLSRYGIAGSQYHFIDGSGGGDTTATGIAVTRMLDALAKSPARQALYDALPDSRCRRFACVREELPIGSDAGRRDGEGSREDGYLCCSSECGQSAAQSAGARRVRHGEERTAADLPTRRQRRPDLRDRRRHESFPRRRDDRGDALARLLKAAARAL